jgi:hypothetical protein
VGGGNEIGVFFALDKRGSIHVWDLLKNDQQSVLVVDGNAPPVDAPVRLHAPHSFSLTILLIASAWNRPS